MNQYDGFQEFFETRRKSLSRTALLLTGDHAAAEDLLQEAITKTVADGDACPTVETPRATSVR